MSSGKGERQRERGEKVGKVKEQKRERESEDGWEIRERVEGKTVKASDICHFTRLIIFMKYLSNTDQ